jgi:nucleobase:cation symporter-1, NCS1 family
LELVNAVGHYWADLLVNFGVVAMTFEATGAAAPKRASADRDAWPLLPSERTWNQRQLFVVLVVSAVATWCYIIGQFVGYYLNFWQGFATLTAGSMIGMLLVTVAVVPGATRFGVDSIATAKPFFGSRGWMLAALLQYLSIIGWNALLLIFFSKSTSQLLVTMGLLSEGATGFVAPILTTIACISVYVTLLRGSTGVEKVSKVLFGFIVAVGAWMLFMLLTQKFGDLAAAKPSAPNADRVWNYTTGVEIGIASLLSWWPYIGAMVRVVPSAPQATLPSMLGMGLPVPLLSAIGLATSLVFAGESDPSKWLISLGGPFFGSIALLFVIAANFGTSVTGAYASAVGLKHLPLFSGLSWPVTLAIALAPVGIVGIVVPDLFFSNFGNFLAFIGVMFAPLCGIQIVDYYLLRGQQLSIRGIYATKPGSPYYFLGGFNPAGFVAMAAGFFTYVYLLNPVSYASNAPYQFITASLPTCFVGGLVYWLVTKFVCIPQGWGNYEP